MSPRHAGHHKQLRTTQTTWVNSKLSAYRGRTEVLSSTDAGPPAPRSPRCPGSAALSAGTAEPFGQGFPWLVRYLDSWWVLYEHGWLRVIDEHVAADLDHVGGRLAKAERAELCNFPERAAGSHTGPPEAL